MKTFPSPGESIIFVLGKSQNQRQELQNALLQAGYAAMAFASLEQAETLLKNNAVCHLVLIATDTLVGNEQSLATLIDSINPEPRLVVAGPDPDGKASLFCLNHSSAVFLPQPYSQEQLLAAVTAALQAGPDNSDNDHEAISASIPVSGWVELTASSELEQLRRMQRFTDALFTSRLPVEVCEDLKMTMEEVGRNAIEWGNKFDPDKQVHISYCFFKDRIVMKFEDEGEGFKPESVPDPTADPAKAMRERQNAGKRPGGYGVYMVQRLVDEVVYNERGNSVLMIKYLPPVANE